MFRREQHESLLCVRRAFPCLRAAGKAFGDARPAGRFVAFVTRKSWTRRTRRPDSYRDTKEIV